MGRSIQLFIEKSLEEKRLLEHLNCQLKCGAETIDIPLNDAEYFAQLQDYDEGFSCGLNISWRDDDSLDIDDIGLALSIAIEFNTTVLLEPNNSCEWCLVDSEGAKYAVSVLELDDGICVKEESGRVLLG